MGDTVGLAYKDQAPGAQFSLEVRLNSCDKAIGAFDLELTYDKQVLQVISVVAHGATVGVTFNANALSKPGTIYMNAAFNPQAPAKKGAALPIAMVHFKALKGGSGVSAMGGLVVTVVALDSITPIGPPTPRYLVAAAGDLDPECSDAAMRGDVNGDCIVSGADLRLLKAALAGAVVDREAMARGDLNHDGRADVADLILIQQIID
jgi:hypothetical protein